MPFSEDASGWKAGFFGAYTFLLRGNVFCNAQTGNVVLMGMVLGAKKWSEDLYYLIPISAYLMGHLHQSCCQTQSSTVCQYVGIPS